VHKNLSEEQREKLIEFVAGNLARKDAASDDEILHQVSLDRPHQIVLAHILVQHRGKQRALLAIRPLNKALHSIPRKAR